MGLAESLPTPLPSRFSKFTRASSRTDIFSVCKRIPYKAACESMLSTALSAPPQTPGELFDRSVKFSKGQAHWARALAYNLSLTHAKAHSHLDGGVNDCLELLDDSLDQLANIVNRKKTPSPDASDDVQTWLSAALTNQATCLESLQNQKFNVQKGVMNETAQNLSHFIRNSLALYMSTEPKEAEKSSISGGHRRLLSNGFPKWVSAPERKILLASIGEIELSAMVAKDGSGTHMTIGEALVLVSSLVGGGRAVIHITAGTYHENIKIPTKQKNVMLVGDGKGKTVIVGDRSFEEGWTTFQSATVAAMGDGFIARDITFVNSAGPAKRQAVALRVGSDKSVIFRCSILGYQDTLYTHSKRQFYRETDIYGTVDFIFGNSAVVFQSCNIYVRKPLSGQDNFITAQGRSSPDENTGISIHNCKIAAASDLAPVKSNFATYLGRPWKQYSRTVILQSFMDDLIHPSGWSPWSGNFALKTLYYGEYMNSGPGASTSRRVKWPGSHSSLTSTEAQGFTVAGFIAGNLWLPSTGVSFDSGLLN
ncbi:putative pectinesterase/pectinesterase inhibitor 35 [Morella rubra]|uniref:Pectinesterase n=1 Tax=Morella rubra TaxID=262757 RepID=A0A6A1VNV0_9ROSI|nr:putative pectinesterase/pectinesterase inhibitor 35 [Morella rubra]KAB1213408.1 putative pectinesterase/pectinesterase inhibitor 35 [Morella rubra]